MKNIIFFLIAFSIIKSYSQQKEGSYTNSINSNFSPPGTIKLNDSLFIDVAPIDNLMYKEFLNSIETFWTLNKHETILKAIDNTEDIKINFKDELDYNLLLKMSINEKLTVGKSLDIKTYLNHPKYQYYPIVNITKVQAEMYCLWRSDMVKLKQTLDNKNYNFVYRLPTTSELEKAQFLFGFKKKIKKENSFLSPYRKRYLNKNNEAVFYNNNLSEYTLDSIPYGSNWRNKNSFDELNDYTGFRCVCEILN